MPLVIVVCFLRKFSPIHSRFLLGMFFLCFPFITTSLPHIYCDFLLCDWWLYMLMPNNKIGTIILYSIDKIYCIIRNGGMNNLKIVIWVSVHSINIKFWVWSLTLVVMNKFLSTCSYDLETLIFEDYNSVDDGGSCRDKFDRTTKSPMVCT